MTEIQSYEYRDRFVFVDFPNTWILVYLKKDDGLGKQIYKTTTITGAIEYADAYVTANP